MLMYVMSFIYMSINDIRMTRGLIHYSLIYSMIGHGYVDKSVKQPLTQGATIE